MSLLLLLTSAAAAASSQPAPATQAAVQIAWRQAEAPYQQRQRKVPVGATIDNPPGVGSPKVVEIPDAQPQQRRNLYPQPVVAADNPARRENAALIAWIPANVAIQLQRKLPQEVRVDSPAPKTRLPDWTPWIPPDPPIQIQPQLPPSISAAQIDSPIPPRWMRNVLEAWTPVDPPAQIRSKPPPAVVADQPKPSPQANLASWVSQDQPQQGKKLPPSILDAQIDRPIPHVRQPDFAHWVKVDPLPQTAPKYVHVAVVVTDNPPFGRYVPNWSWGDDTIIPMGGAALIQSIDRPIYHPVWFDGVYRSWVFPDPALQRARAFTSGAQINDPPPHVRQPDWSPWIPPDPRAILTTKSVPPSVVVQIDDPPGVGSPKIIEIPDGPPQQRRILTATGVQVNDPPFSQRVELDLAPWKAPDPLPQLQRKYVPESVVVTEKTPFKRLHPSWTVEEPYQQRRTLTVNGVQADNSIGLPDWFHTVYRAWDQLPPLPQVSPKYVQAIAADAPPVKGLPLEYTPWKAPDPPLQEQKQLAPSLLAVTVNDPPPLQTLWFDTINQAWQPPPPLPTLNAQLTPPDGPPVVVVPPVDTTPGLMGIGPTRAQFRALCKKRWEEVERAAELLEQKALEVTGKRRQALEAAAQAAHAAAEQACRDEQAELQEATRLLSLIKSALRAKSLSETVTTANAAKTYARKVTDEMDEEEDEMAIIMRFFR